jgi:hypothetical protein
VPPAAGVVASRPPPPREEGEGERGDTKAAETSDERKGAFGQLHSERASEREAVGHVAIE